MSVKINADPVVTASAQPIALSAVLTATPSASDPEYIVVDVLDRDEYAASASGATGSLIGNGLSLGLGSLGGDARGAGIVFTYQPSTGRYHNWSYGYLDQLNFLPSSSAGDISDLSFWSTNSLSLATSYGSNAQAMMQVDASGYLGSVTVATEPSYTGAGPGAGDATVDRGDRAELRRPELEREWVLGSLQHHRRRGRGLVAGAEHGVHRRARQWRVVRRLQRPGW